MEIRKAKAADALDLARLMGELGYPHTAETISANLLRFENRGGGAFVAIYEGVIAGCIGAAVDVRLAEGECGEVVSLIVSRGFRGKGIGKELLQHAEEWLGTQTGSIRIRANAVRKEAHEFYKSLGYHEVKTQKVFKKIF